MQKYVFKPLLIIQHFSLTTSFFHGTVSHNQKQKGEIMNANEKALKLITDKEYGNTRENRVATLARVITVLNAEQVLTAYCVEMAELLTKKNNSELTALETELIKSMKGGK